MRIPLHAKPGDVGQCNLRNLPDTNHTSQRRPSIHMLTFTQNMSITYRTPMSLRNLQSLPDLRMRHDTPTTNSCKVCRCFSAESNSFKALKNPSITQNTSNTSRARSRNATNPITPKTRSPTTPSVTKSQTWPLSGSFQSGNRQTNLAEQYRRAKTPANKAAADLSGQPNKNNSLFKKSSDADSWGLEVRP